MTMALLSSDRMQAKKRKIGILYSRKMAFVTETISNL